MAAKAIPHQVAEPGQVRQRKNAVHAVLCRMLSVFTLSRQHIRFLFVRQRSRRQRDSQSHTRLSDLSESVSKLPHVPTERMETQAATGTDGNRLTNHSTKTEAPQCRPMPKNEFSTGLNLARTAKEKNRKSQSDENLRVNSVEEAPPGFEPGMADLQWA